MTILLSCHTEEVAQLNGASYHDNDTFDRVFSMYVRFAAILPRSRVHN